MTIAINALSPTQWAATSTPRTLTTPREVTPETIATITRGVRVMIHDAPVKPATLRAARAAVTAKAMVRPGLIRVDGDTVRYLEGVTWMIAGRI